MRSKSTFLSLALLALLCLAGPLPAAEPDDVARHRSCIHCGMDRKAYGYSRTLVLYRDGGETGLCSLRCVVVELDANPGREVKTLLVADRATRKLVEAEKAVWTLGGNKPGVMTRTPKWAFATREGADRFLEEHGGTVAPWTEVLDGARKELERKR